MPHLELFKQVHFLLVQIFFGDHSDMAMTSEGFKFKFSLHRITCFPSSHGFQQGCKYYKDPVRGGHVSHFCEPVNGFRATLCYAET